MMNDDFVEYTEEEIFRMTKTLKILKPYTEMLEVQLKGLKGKCNDLEVANQDLKRQLIDMHKTLKATKTP